MVGHPDYYYISQGGYVYVSQRKGKNTYWIEVDGTGVNDSGVSVGKYRRLDLNNSNDQQIFVKAASKNKEFRINVWKTEGINTNSGFGTKGIAGLIVNASQKEFLDDPRVQITMSALSILVGGGPTAARVSKSTKLVAQSRWIRENVFGLARTAQGGRVVTLLGRVQYVGYRTSKSGRMLGYTRSIKVRGSTISKWKHLFDF